MEVNMKSHSIYLDFCIDGRRSGIYTAKGQKTENVVITLGHNKKPDN